MQIIPEVSSHSNNVGLVSKLKYTPGYWRVNKKFNRLLINTLYILNMEELLYNQA